MQDACRQRRHMLFVRSLVIILQFLSQQSLSRSSAAFSR
jgi:hypothetical protein